jgi:MFS family permease
MFASICALIASTFIAKQIKRYHTYGLTFGLTIAEIIVITMFAFTHNIYLLVFFFIVHYIVQTLLYVCLNVFIESFSKHAETGSIRGLFLALFNIGILISPLIGGTILENSSFEILYVVSALMLIPFMFFLHKYLSQIEEPAYHSISMLKAFKPAWRNKNLRAAMIAQFMVSCFYAVMIIYSPIYISTLGISLTTYLSFILPFSLVPLVVLPYEIGFLADTKFGEKELMITGLVILSVTTFLCVITTSTNPLVWIAILGTSRIGASFVETMAFTYYFKKIGPEDASLTAIFSNMIGVSTIVVGAIGVAVSPFIVERPQIMFVILGCAILFSIYYVLPMRDTR